MEEKNELIGDLTDQRWSELEGKAKISERTLGILHVNGFERMTPVQAVTVPLFLQNKDVTVEACTGSGKTLSFVVPLVERLFNSRADFLSSHLQALVLVPTRELAEQVFSVLALFFPPSEAEGEEADEEDEEEDGGEGGEQKKKKKKKKKKAKKKKDEMPWDRQSFVHTEVVTKGVRRTFTARLLTGGRGSAEGDVDELRRWGASVLVGTPGRVETALNLATSRLVDTRNFAMLVMDEADRLLEMGFRETLDRILARLPKQRRTGIFSATQTEDTFDLIRAGLRNPVRVAVAVERKRSSRADVNVDVGDAGDPQQQAIPRQLTNLFMLARPDARVDQLLAFLATRADRRVIVYFLTCAQVDFFHNLLTRLQRERADLLPPEVRLHALYGKAKQEKRKRALDAFRAAPGGVLLATDVAARGIDVPDVDWVVQFDPPQDPKSFVHRVGRTARMGKSGCAVVFLDDHELQYVDVLEMYRVPIAKAEPHPDAPSAYQACLALVRRERELMDMANVAFVSFVRGYSEHYCKMVFRLKKLDVPALARAFCVLKLPRMRELAAHDVSAFVVPATDEEIAAVPYQNRAREEKRQRLLQERAALPQREDSPRKGKRNEAWSKSKEKTDRKKKRRREIALSREQHPEVLGKKALEEDLISQYRKLKND